MDLITTMKVVVRSAIKMGFDLYGLNPLMRKGEVMPQEPNWKDKKAVDEYFKITNRLEKENCGIYFRNNVWWWRSIAGAIELTCYDLLSEKQAKGLHFNDGVKYDNLLAIKIAERLEKMLEENRLDLICKPIKEELEEDGKYQDLYPYSEDNFENFCMFLRESGGFQIC